MKKVFTLILCVLLIGILAVPAFAAQSATMSVSASKSTAYRGDMITVTVSTSKVDGCTTGGFMFSFDKNAFEYVSGSALLSGFSAGVSTQAGNVAGYFMNGNATVQGGLFQITLQVKDTAAFGTYSISGTPSLTASDGAVSCGAGSAVVTVACNHSYSGWNDAGNGKHSKTCSVCQDVQSLDHDWNSGTVTKPASCKEEGEKTLTCTACSATKTESIDKTNDHSYGGWVKENDTTHKHSCTICQKEETANHTWNGGEVTKKPNCKEEGVKTFTCTACSATKTEAIDKTTTHTYGNWTKVNDTTHKHSCTVCQKEETANHTWNGGEVTKKPNCKEEGVKALTCTACSATKTEAIAKTTTHTYGSWTKVNDTTHKHSCTVCQKEETANHTWNSGVVTKQANCKEAGVKTFTCTGCGDTRTEEIAKLTTHAYDHACDTDCNICGLTRTTTHNYKKNWSKNEASHWYECSVCKDKKDVADHTPGAAPTEKKAQTCTVCGYIIKPALGHTHSYATAWTTNETGHWYACSGCEEKGSYADHDFENACDPDCSICGYTRETKHTYEDKWTSNEINHWHVCTGCGLKIDETAHAPGAEATATTAQTCTICGYEIAPALGVPETEPTTAETTPTGTNASEQGSFSWWIVPVVVVIGCVTAVIIIKKKKS